MLSIVNILVAINYRNQNNNCWVTNQIVGRYLSDDADVTLEVALWAPTCVVGVREQSPLVVELVV